jgi:hypothetical protein
VSGTEFAEQDTLSSRDLHSCSRRSGPGSFVLVIACPS